MWDRERKEHLALDTEYLQRVWESVWSRLSCCSAAAFPELCAFIVVVVEVVMVVAVVVVVVLL